MPTYQYLCTECGNGLEVQQRFSESSLTICPTCTGKLRKVFNAVGVVFKGSGFYRNDSRETGASKAGADASSGASGEKSSTSDGGSTSSDSTSSSGNASSSSSDSTSSGETSSTKKTGSKPTAPTPA